MVCTTNQKMREISRKEAGKNRNQKSHVRFASLSRESRRDEERATDLSGWLTERWGGTDIKERNGTEVGRTIFVNTGQ
jgi:hypothetical protein